MARRLVPGAGRIWRGSGPAARASFAAVYRSLPGELAPKLALGDGVRVGRRDGRRSRRLVRDRVAHRPGVHRRHLRPRALPAGGGRPARRARRLRAGSRLLERLRRGPDGADPVPRASATARGSRHRRRSAGGRLDPRAFRSRRAARAPARPSVLEAALALAGAAERSTTAAPASSATSSPSATCGSASSAPTGSSPGWAATSASGSSWSIGPTEFDRGRGHDASRRATRHEDVDVSTESRRFLPLVRSPPAAGDRFCERCGARLEDPAQPTATARAGRARPRDRGRGQRSGPVHRRNEDSFHLEVTGERDVAAVVCDGISSASAGNVAARDARRGRRSGSRPGRRRSDTGPGRGDRRSDRGRRRR